MFIENHTVIARLLAIFFKCFYRKPSDYEFSLFNIIYFPAANDYALCNPFPSSSQDIISSLFSSLSLLAQNYIILMSPHCLRLR